MAKHIMTVRSTTPIKKPTVAHARPTTRRNVSQAAQARGGDRGFKFNLSGSPNQKATRL